MNRSSPGWLMNLRATETERIEHVRLAASRSGIVLQEGPAYDTTGRVLPTCVGFYMCYATTLNPAVVHRVKDAFWKAFRSLSETTPAA